MPTSINSSTAESIQAAKDYLEGLPNSEVPQVVSNMRDEMRRLATENTVLENFLQLHEPSLIAGMGKAMQVLNEMQGQLMSFTSIKSMMTGTEGAGTDSQSLASASRSILSRRFLAKGRGPRVSFAQRTDLVMRETDGMQQQLTRLQTSSHRQTNVLKAEIEENGIRHAELEETAGNFEQQVVIDGVEKLTQKIPAEKFIRYMQEWLKSAQIMLEKLRLRTNSLRTQEKKLKALLTQKEDLGDCVHEVDFEKLGIENKNFLGAIERKNANLLELKQINGKANLLLTTHKNFLHKQDEYMKEIVSQMDAVQREHRELKVQFELTQAELERERNKYDKIKRVVGKYQVPDVMDYILKKSELHEQKKQLKVWKRKLNIQTIVMQTYTKIMCHLTSSSRPKAEWCTAKTFSWENVGQQDGHNLEAAVHKYFANLKRLKSTAALNLTKKTTDANNK